LSRDGFLFRSALKRGTSAKEFYLINSERAKSAAEEQKRSGEKEGLEGEKERERERESAKRGKSEDVTMGGKGIKHAAREKDGRRRERKVRAGET